jgi:hypothetical protein
VVRRMGCQHTSGWALGLGSSSPTARKRLSVIARFDGGEARLGRGALKPGRLLRSVGECASRYRVDDVVVFRSPRGGTARDGLRSHLDGAAYFTEPRLHGIRIGARFDHGLAADHVILRWD